MGHRRPRNSLPGRKPPWRYSKSPRGDVPERRSCACLSSNDHTVRLGLTLSDRHRKCTVQFGQDNRPPRDRVNYARTNVCLRVRTLAAPARPGLRHGPDRHGDDDESGRLRGRSGLYAARRSDDRPLYAGTLAVLAVDPAQGATVQGFREGEDIPASWWTLFHSEPLNRLIADALKASPTLESAKAALREARENVYAQQGAFYPSLSASVSATREKESGAAFGIPGLNSLFSVTTGELNISYTPDCLRGHAADGGILRGQRRI